VRELRALLRHRVMLVRLRTSAKNRIHAVLADHGLDREEGLWTGPGRAWLAELRLPTTARLIVDDYPGLIDSLAAPLAAVEEQIAARAQPDPRVKVLTALPGVGQLTAMTLLAEIADITRFPTARKLCAWAGLTPTVRNSDRKVRHGHITKAGPPWVRWILAEAAQRAKRDPAFASAYAAIAHRRGKHIATTANCPQAVGPRLPPAHRTCRQHQQGCDNNDPELDDIEDNQRGQHGHHHRARSYSLHEPATRPMT
jgi:transposase